MSDFKELLKKYEIVVGLEVHAQLSTQSKVFCSDSAEFGARPNHHISPVSLGLPGALPMLNERVVEYAIKMGLATHCKIREENHFARKNYFYADLPKGYQITQDTTPICYEGYVDIKLKDSGTKRIGITRIHIEEDAGKSMHDQDVYDSLIDLNRAGVPLVEIVSEPDIRSGDEAYAYLTEVRKIVRYLAICDGNMEEGSMRCDANISVRIRGAKEFGKRCEVKNLNSIRNVQRAIEHEAERQMKAIEAGETIDQNTLNFDATTGKTSVLRTKEMANDYRYFPEPDLQPLIVAQEYISEIKSNMPPLPEELFARYTQELKLPEYDAMLLTADRDTALFFEQLIKYTSNYKAAANWIMGTIKSYLNENALDIKDFKLGADKVAALITLVDEGKLSNSVAGQQVFPVLMTQQKASVLAIAQELNVLIESSDSDVANFIEQALSTFPDKVTEYKSGKKGVLGLFMGEIMKLSKGKIDPKQVNTLLLKRLEA